MHERRRSIITIPLSQLMILLLFVHPDKNKQEISWEYLDKLIHRNKESIKLQLISSLYSQPTKTNSLIQYIINMVQSISPTLEFSSINEYNLDTEELESE